MNTRSLAAGLAIALSAAACTSGAKKHDDVAADASAALSDRERDLAAQIADASAQLEEAKKEFTASYTKGRADSKDALNTLDAKAATLKTKAAKLTGAKKTRADAAVELYEKRSAAAAAAIASLPADQPDASAAESSIAALLPLFQAARDAYDALARVVNGT